MEGNYDPYKVRSPKQDFILYERGWYILARISVVIGRNPKPPYTRTSTTGLKVSHDPWDPRWDEG